MHKNKLFLGVFFALALLSLVSSAGISSPYWKDNPLYMSQGETKIVNFKLQNMVGESDITVKAEITKGMEIASLQTDTFTAKAQTSDTTIPVVVTVPQGFEDDVQEVTLEVRTVENQQGGMVSIGSGWTTSFDVIIQKDEGSSNVAPIIAFVIVILLIVFVIIYFVHGKGASKRNYHHTKAGKGRRK
jgi:hypothetical protein